MIQFAARLPAITVRIARHRTLHPVPCVAGRHLGLFPAEAAVALSPVPAALQVVLDLIELAPLVTIAGFPAVTVGRGELVVGCAAGVGACLVVLAPISVLLRRIH